MITYCCGKNAYYQEKYLCYEVARTGYCENEIARLSNPAAGTMGESCTMTTTNTLLYSYFRNNDESADKLYGCSCTVIQSRSLSAFYQMCITWDFPNQLLNGKRNTIVHDKGSKQAAYMVILVFTQRWLSNTFKHVNRVWSCQLLFVPFETSS